MCSKGTCDFAHDRLKPGEPCYRDPNWAGPVPAKTWANPQQMERIRAARLENAKRLGVTAKELKPLSDVAMAAVQPASSPSLLEQLAGGLYMVGIDAAGDGPDALALVDDDDDDGGYGFFDVNGPMSPGPLTAVGSPTLEAGEGDAILLELASSGSIFEAVDSRHEPLGDAPPAAFAFTAENAWAGDCQGGVGCEHSQGADAAGSGAGAGVCSLASDDDPSAAASLLAASHSVSSQASALPAPSAFATPDGAGGRHQSAVSATAGLDAGAGCEIGAGPVRQASDTERGQILAAHAPSGPPAAPWSWPANMPSLLHLGDLVIDEAPEASEPPAQPSPVAPVHLSFTAAAEAAREGVWVGSTVPPAPDEPISGSISGPGALQARVAGACAPAAPAAVATLGGGAHATSRSCPIRSSGGSHMTERAGLPCSGGGGDTGGLSGSLGGPAELPARAPRAPTSPATAAAPVTTDAPLPPPLLPPVAPEIAAPTSFWAAAGRFALAASLIAMAALLMVAAVNGSAGAHMAVLQFLSAVCTPGAASPMMGDPRRGHVPDPRDRRRRER